jgi:hypothetical protein
MAMIGIGGRVWFQQQQPWNYKPSTTKNTKRVPIPQDGLKEYATTETNAGLNYPAKDETVRYAETYEKGELPLELSTD